MIGEDNEELDLQMRFVGEYGTEMQTRQDRGCREERSLRALGPLGKSGQ